MRKYLLALITVLLMSGTVFAATPGFRQNPGTGDILGQKKYQSDAHKVFRMVRFVQPSSGFASAAVLPKGSIVVWDVTQDDGITVTTTTTSNDSTVAGVLATQALTQDTQNNTAAQDVGADNWTWLQTYGYNSDVDTHANLGYIPVGGAFGASATLGLAAGCIDSATQVATGSMGCAGVTLDAAITAGTDIEVFIKGVD